MEDVASALDKAEERVAALLEQQQRQDAAFPARQARHALHPARPCSTPQHLQVQRLEGLDVQCDCSRGLTHLLYRRCTSVLMTHKL